MELDINFKNFNSHLDGYLFDKKKVYNLLSKHKCNQCGNCCSWDGYVYLSKKCLNKISDFFHMPKEKFITMYCEIICDRNTYMLCLKKHNSSCIYYSNCCTIHNVKPDICVFGASSWAWVTTEKNMKFYTQNSNSFNNESSEKILIDNISKMEKSAELEYKLRKITSLKKISEYFDIPLNTMLKLEVIFL